MGFSVSRAGIGAMVGISTSGGASSSSSSSSSASSSTSSSSSSSSSANALTNALSRFSTPSSTQSFSRTTRSSFTSTAGISTTPSVSSSISSSSGGGGFELVLQTVVPAGTRVKKGDVVAEFDRQFMMLRLDDYEVQLDQQAAGLTTLKANLDVEKKAHAQSIAAAKATLEKARYDLKTVPVQSAIAAEKMTLAEEEATAQYKQLLREVKNKEIAQQSDWRISQLQLDQNRLEFQRAQANADRMLFRAPLDGIAVMSTMFRNGEFSQIRAGDQVHPGMMFMRVVDPDSMVVETVVNQADIEKIRIGARAKVRIDAYPGVELPGRVHSIGAMPKTGGFRTDYVKEVPVVVKLERLDPRLAPDLSVSVDVVVESAPAGPVAPREAVFRDAPDGPAYVFVQTATGWERRPVELGVMNFIAAAVRSGLRGGERIAAERPVLERRK